MSETGITLTGEWEAAKMTMDGASEDIDQALEAAILALAEYFVGRLKKKIASNVPPANSGLTIMQKRSSKTLINSGDMRNSVTTVVQDKHNVFVGIPRTVSARGAKSGVGFKAVSSSQAKLGSVANLAQIMEQGRTIVQRVTDKQRRFLHATLGKKASKVPSGQPSSGVIVIHIPPRPFIKPTFDEELPGAPARFQKLFLANLERIGKKVPAPAPKPPPPAKPAKPKSAKAKGVKRSKMQKKARMFKLTPPKEKKFGPALPPKLAKRRAKKAASLKRSKQRKAAKKAARKAANAARRAAARAKLAGK